MGSRVFVLELINPQGEGRIRVFANRAKATRVARRWTGATADASASEWRGEDGRADYDAYLYAVRVEP